MKKKIFTVGMTVLLLLAAVAVGSMPSVMAQAPSVTRDLPSGAQTAGSTITVSLDVTVGSATYYLIDEEVPTGWTVTSASGDGDYTTAPGHIFWTKLSGVTDTTLTYTVTIPADAAGDYTFAGTYVMEGMTAEATIGGETTVNVGVGPTPTPTPSPTPTPTPTPTPQAVTRDLPAGTQTAGSTITVSLAVVTGGADVYMIDEQVPSGWTVTSASGDGDYTTTPGHIFWTKLYSAPA